MVMSFKQKPFLQGNTYTYSNQTLKGVARVAQALAGVDLSRKANFDPSKCRLPVVSDSSALTLQEVIALAKSGELGSTELPFNHL